MNEINRNVISNSDNMIKLGTLSKSPNSHSIISTHQTRKDVYGNTISKKIKMHKISFADQVQNNTIKFVEIKTVRSYRTFNRYQEVEEDTWGCRIF